MAKNIVDVDELIKILPLVSTVSLVFFMALRSLFDERYVTRREYDNNKQDVKDKIKDLKGDYHGRNN